MLIEKRITEKGAAIGIWEINETIPEMLDLLHNKEVYHADLEKFASEKRKKELIAARLLVEMLCGDDKIIVYDAKDKPYLIDGSFHISISHTKNFVALIVHPTSEVGIDIEKIGDKVCRLKQRFLHDDELAQIDSLNEVNHLLLYWCAKEVIFKILNQEGIDFSEHLRIVPFTPLRKGTFEGSELFTKKNEMFAFAYSIEKEFVMVWAVK